MDLLGMIVLAPVMVAVALSDLRHMRIPNSLSLIGLGLLVAVALAFPPEDLPARLAVAMIVFTLGFLGFALGLVGGGDVKILSVMLLAVPANALPIYAYVFSASMFVGIAAILALRRVPQVSGWGWKAFGGSTGFPMGLSIALSGLSFPLVAALLRGV